MLGQVSDASNATLVVEAGDHRLVYKPVRGERPLWDFPDGTLARREVAAYEISRHLGWDVVPPTRWVEDGPYGPGSVQDWVGDDVAAVSVFREGAVPEGWLPVLQAVDDADRPLVVAHADTPRLRLITVFDLVVNNADRKGGHLLGDGDAAWGIDHGLSFHAEPKLRSVLWGFVGRPIDDGVLADLADRRDDLPDLLVGLSGAEGAALRARVDRVLADGVFPPPRGGPVIPWPPI